MKAIASNKHKSTNKRSFWYRLSRNWDLQALALPGMILLIVFSYIPMFGLVMAFQDYNIFSGISGFFTGPWVGFKHFTAFFQAPEFYSVMRNTLVISLLKLVICFPIPILLALMLNEVTNVRLKKSIQTITYMPYFLSWVVVSGFVFTFFGAEDGIINQILMALGMADKPVQWLVTPKYFWGILVGTNVWKFSGYNAIIYLAAISGIDPAYYEAASIDGATKLQKIFKITLPCIMPVIMVLLVLQLGNVLNAGFDDVYLLTNNGKNYALTEVGQTLDTYVYQRGVLSRRYSYGAAVGMFKSVFNVIFLTGANMAVRKINGTSIW